jgi:hypothetical protein
MVLEAFISWFLSSEAKYSIEFNENKILPSYKHFLKNETINTKNIEI